MDSDKVEVYIDPDLCAGNAECVRVAPEVFELDETAGIATTRPGPWKTSPDALRLAEASCPTQAITIKRAAS